MIKQTCIVAVKDGDKVFIGADSGVTFGSGRQHPHPRSKVFVSGEMLYGGTGNVRPIQVIEHSVVSPIPYEGQNEYSYIVNSVSMSMRDSLLKAGCLHQYHGMEWMDAGFLVVLRKKIFYISDDFGIVEYGEGYGATGSGEEFAFGSLKSTEYLKNKPIKRVRLALEAATQFNYGVSPPFNIIGMEWKEDGSIVCYNEKDVAKFEEIEQASKEEKAF